MGNYKTKKYFGILLASLLILRLSYHTLHVFTSHASDSHIENATHTTQIEKTSFTCELCAKLLGQFAYLWAQLSILLCFVATILLIDPKDLLFRPGVRAVCLLRGPPLP